jgi:hypothetical protein
MRASAGQWVGGRIARVAASHDLYLDALPSVRRAIGQVLHAG